MIGTLVIAAVVIVCAVYLLAEFWRDRDFDVRDDGRVESPLWDLDEWRSRR